MRQATMLAAACLGLASVGCGNQPEQAPAVIPSDPTPGGTVVVGLFSDLDNLNEFVSTDANATEVMESMLYMPLLAWNADIELEGRLARDWKFSDDGRTVTMTLRDDVRWHDGTPTTAYDVEFTFRTFLEPDLAYSAIGDLRYLETIEALSDTEVRFHFSRAYADQLAHLRKIILPKHLLKDVPAAEMSSAPFNRNPTGNGPFRFVRWKQQQEIVFEANPDFCDGRPFLDRVVIRVIPDQTAIETAFRTGEIDVVERLRLDSVGKLRDAGWANVHTREQRGYQFVCWNTQNPLFATAKSRLAMTLALDREGLLDGLVFGEGKVTAHPVMSLSPHYAADITPHPYAPDSARALLAEEGWRDSDGDGVLDRDGEAFEFSLVTNLGNQLREDTVVMIQDDLKKIGVNVKPVVREWTVFLEDIKGKRFDACHLAWQTDFIVNPWDVFHTDAIDGKYNMGSFSHAEVDRRIDAGLLARTKEEATSHWREFQDILHAEQPYTILMELMYSVGTSTRLRGVEIDVRGPFVGVEDWWIAPSERKYAS